MTQFASRDIGLRTQKKILSQFATKNIAKVFIDDTTAALLDNLYKLNKYVCGDKKVAEKLVKNIIKIVVKIGITYRNDQLTKEDIMVAESFKKKFRSMMMVIVSFHEVDFSYDRRFLTTSLLECKSLLEKLVSSHLSAKSIARIDSIFSFYSDPAFLDEVFKSDSKHKDLFGTIVKDIDKLIEDGKL